MRWMPQQITSIDSHSLSVTVNRVTESDGEELTDCEHNEMNWNDAIISNCESYRNKVLFGPGQMRNSICMAKCYIFEY